MIEVQKLQHELLELVLLLAHLNPAQIKGICQFVQINIQAAHEEWLPKLGTILQSATASQVERLYAIASTRSGEEDSRTAKDLETLVSELSVAAKDADNLRGSFALLLGLHQLQRLLQSLSILQLMKMFEIVPPGPPVQQLQLLQQIKQLFAQLKQETVQSLHNDMQSAPQGTEQQKLISILNLPSEYFQLYQPLRLLLQLELNELMRLQEILPRLEPAQILQLLQLLQLQPFDVLELKNMLNPSEYTPIVTAEVPPQPNISQTPMDAMDSDEPEAEKRGEMQLQIVEQPPEKSVYKRNLKPNPMVMINGEQINDNNLYVVPILVRCDTFSDEPKYLTGNRPVRVANGRVLTFRKLKITTTSHQQQETLFCIKFELRKYVKDDEYILLDTVHSTPVSVLSHSTQMKPVPTVAAVVTEVVPASGDSNGGTRVAILGSSFVDSPATRVRFDTADVVPTFHGPGTLICTVPEHAPGTVAVKVSNSPKKWSDTQANFTYIDFSAQPQNKEQIHVSSYSPQAHFDVTGWPGSSYYEGDSANMHDSMLGSDVINALDSRGFTNLQYAVAAGDSRKTSLLLQHGANPNIQDKDGNTALYWASVEGCDGIVRSLLSHGANPFIVNNFGVGPLYAAAAACEPSTLSLLLSASTHLVNQSTLDGVTPLHIACVTCNDTAVSNIIRSGAYLNAQDDEGDSPLHFAVRENRPEVVDLLLRSGAMVDIRNEDEETPLQLAISLGYEAIVYKLIQYGASLYEQDVEGASPLHAACEQGSQAIIRFLIENGADPNLRNNQQQTPLHVAAILQNHLVVQYLLSVGASRDAMDKYGCRAINYLLPLKGVPSGQCAPREATFDPLSTLTMINV
jgi:ankyrin repeat protein